MSNFEYMGQVTIGQYLPIDSFLHRLDPRARILIFSFFILLITFDSRISALIACLAFVIFGLFLGRIPFRFAMRGLIPPLPFLLILALLQVFIAPGSLLSPVLFQCGILVVRVSGIVAGVTLIVRFIALILCLSLATFCLSSSQLVHGLEALLRPLNRIKIPTRDLIMVIQITVRFLPILAQTAEMLAKAQAARGAEWGDRKGNLFQRVRQFIPILVPLFISSLRKAENMALAMDARAYGSSAKATLLVDFRFRFRDSFAVMVSMLICLAILINAF